MVRLAEAYDYARDMQCDLWDFAVEIEALTAIGLSLDDLRWLVTSGYVRHGREVTRPSDAARRFRPARNLNFTKTDVFCAGGCRTATDGRGSRRVGTEARGVGARQLSVSGEEPWFC